MIKDADAVKRMLDNGQFSTVVAEARYSFPIVARCPRCGAEAFVTRGERWDPSMSKSVFRCSSCFNQFEPAIGNISFA